MQHLTETPTQLWTPSASKCFPKPNMNAFRQLVAEKTGKQLHDYDELYQWSCEHVNEFWSLVWSYVEIKASSPYTKVLDESVPMDQIPQWFEGARLNFTENIFSKFCDDHVAIIATGEAGTVRQLTYRQLYAEVAACSNAMRNLGITVGDRVAAYIPNCAEAVIAMLATASIGAIWSSTSPDFGATGVLDRFQQTEPKLLFSVNAVNYNGKVHDHFPKLKSVADELPSLQKVIVIPFVESTAMPDLNLFGQHWITYQDFVQTTEEPLIYAQLPFNHPLYILCSSGTTGKPKCIVHSAGGVLIQHLKEHIIHGDMSRKDVFFQYTTTGWMMWNWLVSGLAVGCTIVLFDGSPFKPQPWILWDLADQYQFTKFGTSAKYIQSLQEMTIHPSSKYELPHLNEIYSTGSPLTPESFEFVYKHIKADLCLASITGGTDIVSLFAGHNHTVPVHKGEIQSRCLGMAVESWADQGKSVYSESGDLVCIKPFPCMPVRFWKDEDNKKYRDSYFSNYKGVWYHGDFVWINSKTKGVVMLGRSDGTLKPAGVRFGSAELYNIVEKYAGTIADSLAVGQRRPKDNDERVILFLKMCDGKICTKEFIEQLKADIRKQLSPRHVPAIIMPIDDIPYTINGKKVEVAVKKIVSGEDVVATGTLAKPEVLDLYRNLEQLQ